jgi:hypothetical protein
VVSTPYLDDPAHVLHALSRSTTPAGAPLLHGRIASCCTRAFGDRVHVRFAPADPRLRGWERTSRAAECRRQLREVPASLEDVFIAKLAARAGA